jgi:hypothetical protein
MFDELWQEIQDMPGEIFDIPEMNDILEDSIEMDDNSFDELNFDTNYDY